ncbi:MAG: cytochrome c maturation protein CcmE [Alphaproteobacteria bacterium]|nr:cytochrome c maturation protein CcmE [Alphaproteobacteria bacterium]
MKRKHKRLTFVMIGLLLLGSAAALILTAFEDNIVFFYSPTELADKKPDPAQRLRIGGLVMAGSVEKLEGAVVAFAITDTAKTVTVQYKGILPDLFREGQGVVAEGHLKGGVFQADEVLAKHDENYMPPEVAQALKKSGQWKPKETAQ